MKKTVLIFSCISCLLFALYVLRGPLMIFGAKKLIRTAFPNEELTYEKSHLEKGSLIFSGVHLNRGENQLTIDRLEMKVGVNFKKWALSPELSLIRPYLQYTEQGEFPLSTWIRAFKPSGFFQFKMDAHHGILQMDGERFYFSFESGRAKESLGTLKLSLDPHLLSHPFLLAHFEMRGSELLAKLKMSQVQADQVIKLLGMTGLSFARQWSGAKGIVDLEGHAILSAAGEIIESSAQFSFDQVELVHTSQPLVFEANHLSGSLNLGPTNTSFWNEMKASISLENGKLELKDQFALTSINGHIGFDPAEDPSIALTGMLGKVPFSLDGKGVMHDDQTRWLECALQFEQSGKETPQLYASICSPESDEIILRLEANRTSKLPLLLYQTLWRHSPLDLVPHERVLLTVKTKKGKHEFSGLFEAVDKTTIQFGFGSQTLVPLRWSEISDGWLRSSHLEPSFYTSLIKCLKPDLELQGIFDLFGTFDGSVLELSLQCEGLSIYSPLFEMKAAQVGERNPLLLKPKGRAKILYFLNEDKWHLDLPLHEATFYDTASHYSLEGLEADLHYTTEKGYTATLQNAILSFAGGQVLQMTSGEVEGWTLDAFKAKNVQAKLGQFQIQISEFNLAEGLSSLKAIVEEVPLSLQKQEDKIHIQAQLDCGNLEAIIHQAPQSKATIEKLILKGTKGELYAEGELVVDIPSAKLPLCMRADLMFKAHLGDLEFITNERAKVAFSPELGLEVSNLSLQSGELPIAIEQLELLLSKNKVIARGCQFGQFPLKGLCEVENERVLLTMSDSEGEMVLEGKWDGAILEKIEGNWRGLSCKLKRSKPDYLKGRLQIDTAEWISYLPKELQVLPAGHFALEGEFSPKNQYFKGEIQSDFGSATVEITPESVECGDVVLKEEGSGQFKAAKASLRYLPSIRSWGYVIPEAELLQFALSAMPGVSIAKASIHNLHGVLGNLDTLAASGTFAFKAKPSAFREKFHLDPTVGSPLSGEVDYQIKGGSCTLIALRDIATDEKHTQFSLPTQSKSVFDLHGRLFLDLLVKKNDGHKTKKPISLNIRGTLDQPTVTVRN